jgi:hypothetical protein
MGAVTACHCREHYEQLYVQLYVHPLSSSNSLTFSPGRAAASATDQAEPLCFQFADFRNNCNNRE